MCEAGKLEAARAYYYERQAQRRRQREAERLGWLERVREAVACLAPRHPGLRRVYLFGSLTQPGRFKSDSDVDVAVDCDSPETESAFWRDLERELGRDLDIRPWGGAVADAVAAGGEQVYGRQDSSVDEQHPT